MKKEDLLERLFLLKNGTVKKLYIMKTKCMSCGGSMKKMAKGGSMKTTVGKATPKGQIYGIPQTGPTGPNYQGVNTMQKGGKVTARKKMGMGGMHMMPDGSMMENSMMKKGGATKKYKTGGMVKKTKFAALAPPYNKATFADKIVGAKNNASKKK
jgi:hypothetical protein